MDEGRWGGRVSARVREERTASNVRFVFTHRIPCRKTYHKAAISGDESFLLKSRTDPFTQVYETS